MKKQTLFFTCIALLFAAMPAIGMYMPSEDEFPEFPEQQPSTSQGGGGGVMSWLTSGLFNQQIQLVGKEGNKLVKTFGEETKKVLESTPGALEKVEGISANAATMKSHEATISANEVKKEHLSLQRDAIAVKNPSIIPPKTNVNQALGQVGGLIEASGENVPKITTGFNSTLREVNGIMQAQIAQGEQQLDLKRLEIQQMEAQAKSGVGSHPPQPTPITEATNLITKTSEALPPVAESVSNVTKDVGNLAGKVGDVLKEVTKGNETGLKKVQLEFEREKYRTEHGQPLAAPAPPTDYTKVAESGEKACGHLKDTVGHVNTITTNVGTQGSILMQNATIMALSLMLGTTGALLVYKNHSKIKKLKSKESFFTLLGSGMIVAAFMVAYKGVRTGNVVHV